MLEITIALPFLLVAVVGASDFGRGVHRAIELQGAAHAAARFASQSVEETANPDGIAQAAFAALSLNDAYTYEGEHEDEQASEVRAPVKSYAAGDVGVNVLRYCKCLNGTEIECEAGDCGQGAPPSRVYVKVTVERPFQTLISYPGVPREIMLARETHVRGR